MITRKVVSLSEEKLLRMSEEELLADVIDRMVTQINQLVAFVSELSKRLSAVEEELFVSSEPPLFDEEE